MTEEEKELMKRYGITVEPKSVYSYKELRQGRPGRRTQTECVSGLTGRFLHDEGVRNALGALVE
jgi:hypothetical protein